jgi:hypothetical protein
LRRVQCRAEIALKLTYESYSLHKKFSSQKGGKDRHYRWTGKREREDEEREEGMGKEEGGIGEFTRMYAIPHV